MAFELSLLGILGLVIGSFGNAFLWRLHEGISLIRGNSMCPHCRVRIELRDLIPIFSFIALRGKCRACRAQISPEYPIIEIAFTALFIAVGIHFFTYAPYGLLGLVDGSTSLVAVYQLVLTLFFVTILTLLFVYDLRWYLLPDILTIPAIVLGFAANGFLFAPQPCIDTGIVCIMSSSWINLIVAALIGGGFFLMQYIISRGTWIGGGDIRLGALMGVILGYPGILIALFLAYMLGSIVGIGLLVARKKGMKSEVPFGPFLAASTLMTMFFQRDLLNMLSALAIL